MTPAGPCWPERLVGKASSWAFQRRGLGRQEIEEEEATGPVLKELELRGDRPDVSMYPIMPSTTLPSHSVAFTHTHTHTYTQACMHECTLSCMHHAIKHTYLC